MQISSSLAAVIAAVCTAIGALLGTIATTLYQHRLDKIKRRREERDAVSKFKDVLLRSSEQLQSHVGEICSGEVPHRVHLPSLTDPASSYAYCILIYRIGQLLCWIFLLENDIQTIHYTPTSDDLRVRNILEAMHQGLGRPLALPNGRQIPLRIFRGVQDSIGELMTIGDHEKGTQRCMGYPDFWKKWTVTEKSNDFRPWFSQIEDGLGLLMDRRSQDQWFFRVMEFQHLLIELVNALDPKNVRGHTRPQSERIVPPFLAESCLCTDCAKLRNSPHRRPTLLQSTDSHPLSVPTVGNPEPRRHAHLSHSSRPRKTTPQPHVEAVGDLDPRRHRYPEDGYE